MKYTEGTYGMRLEGIREIDLKYRNLAGRYNPNNRYDQEDRPQHVLVVWIDDEDIVKALKEAGFNVKEDEDEYHELGKRHYLQFKAYPKMKMNRITGKDEQAPKVVTITSNNKRVLSAAEFGYVDGAHIDRIDISFHDYEWEKGKHVPSIDQVWCTIDETAGGQNDDYFEKKYGHLKDYEGDVEEEELPFE